MTVSTASPTPGPSASSWFPWRHHQHRHPAIRAAEDERTYGERVADEIASFGGSWPFIFIFLGMIVVWMLVNTLLIQHVLGRRPFDPYPYIALNLVLSGLPLPQVNTSGNADRCLNVKPPARDRR